MKLFLYFLMIMLSYFHHKKNPNKGMLGLKLNSWQWPTFTRGDPVLSSAMHRFTTEFGMVSGGTSALWSPGKLVKQLTLLQSIQYCIHSFKSLRRYMIKTHESLVQVSSIRYRTYTPCLSTSSSRTTLQWPQRVKGDLILKGASRLDAFSGYPVRT